MNAEKNCMKLKRHFNVSLSKFFKKLSYIYTYPASTLHFLKYYFDFPFTGFLTCRCKRILSKGAHVSVRESKTVGLFVYLFMVN
jgi:hypothetical protein